MHTAIPVICNSGEFNKLVIWRNRQLHRRDLDCGSLRFQTLIPMFRFDIMGWKYSSRALKVVTRKRNYKSQARKLSPLGSQLQGIQPHSANSGPRPADLSIPYKESNRPFRCAKRNSTRHARQIQHHHFDPHRHSEWSLGEVTICRYLFRCFTPQKFSWGLDAAMNAELRGGAAIFQTIDNQWQLSTRVRRFQVILLFQ